MKKIIFVLLLAPVFAIAQDSTAKQCKLLRETDPYTKEIRLSTGFISLDGASVTIDADSKEIDVMFSIPGADRCYDNNSVAWIFFEGVKTKLTMRNGGTMNCEGLFHFIFKNSTSYATVLRNIMTQKSEHFEFTGNNKKVTKVYVQPDNQQKLIDLINCLVTEANKLVK